MSAIRDAIMLYQYGVSMRGVGRAIGLPTETVRQALVKHGIPRRSQGGLDRGCVGACRRTGLCPDLWRCRARLLRNGADSLASKAPVIVGIFPADEKRIE